MKKFKNLSEVKDYLGVQDGDVNAKLLVTPNQAKYLLDHANKANRKIKKSHVETLKRDMETGHWYSDIDYIGFNNKGMLINGQHRLKALSEANVENISLKFDFDVEQHISMDTGNVRKYSDQVTISKKLGMEILPNKFRAIILAGLKLNDKNINLSNTELAAIGNAYGQDLIICEDKGLFNLGSKITGGSVVKSSIFWAYLNGVDMNILVNFAEVLRTGITHTENDIPIIRLRDELIDLKGAGRNLDIKRAEYTQQCIYNVLNGSTSNRLPSNPIMHYQDYPFLEKINENFEFEDEVATTHE